MAGIFLSYRRQDVPGIAGRIYDRLAPHFGGDTVFMDMDSIPFGEDFREHIREAVDRCGVLLVVIGPRWAGELGDRRRIDDPRDFVRIEIEAALKRGIPVIPVLIDRVPMPGEAELPPSLASLAYRNAIDVDQGRDFHVHVTRLINGIEHFLNRPIPTPPVPTGGRAEEVLPPIIGDPFAGRAAGEEKQLRVGAVDFSLSWCPPTLGFRMGSPITEAERRDNEGPVDVAITKGFWAMRTQMTQGLYEAIMELALGASPSHFKGPKLPVEKVTHVEAVECARAATRKLREAHLLPEGWELRLMTEAQWEYMARAGSTTAFPWGDSLHAGQANFDGNYPYGGAAKGPNLQKTREVGGYEPNAWKIYDTVGNVWEWTLDAYQAKLLGGTDPSVAGRDMSGRVLRGGSWFNFGRSCRSAYRYEYAPTSRTHYLGFRLAAVPSSP